MKQAFSLFEMIVVIVLIAIISSVGVYKLFFTLNETNSLQIKTQVQLINNALVQKQNEQLLLGNSTHLSALDDALINTKGQKLFDNILNQNILSTSKQESKIASWIKVSQTNYAIYLSKDESIVFSYNQDDNTFECDMKNSLCKEMYE